MRLKNISIILILVILLQIFIPALEVLATDEIVTFEDKDLKKLIVKDYDTSGDGEISKTEIEAIEKLEISSSLYTVKNLSGLEYAINLKRINLELHPSVDTSTIVNEVKKLPINTKIELSGFVNIDFGIMKKGEEKVINYNDDPLLKEAFFDENSKLYTPGATLSDSYNSSIIVNNEDKTITVKGNEFGRNLYQYVRVMPSKRTYSGLYNLYLYMNWTVLENADSTKEIDIPDQNLKNQLLEKCDFDNDKKITECDLKSMHGNLLGYTEDANFSDITDLTGLEYATNLKKLYIHSMSGLNNIDPLSTLNNLESLSLIDITPNADLDKLKDMTKIKYLFIETNEYMDFDLNFTENMGDLHEISLLGAKDIANIENLNNKTLNFIYLRYENANCINNLDKINSAKELKIALGSEDKEENELLVNKLKNTSFEKVYIGIEKDRYNDVPNANAFRSFEYDLGKIEKNATITIKYDEINSIIKNLLDSNYTYYDDEYYMFDTGTMPISHPEDVITFNNERNSITLTPMGEIGTRNYLIKFTSSKADIEFNLKFEIADEIVRTLGDINGDGKTTLYDAFSILRMVILGTNFSEEEVDVIDYNSDNEITLYDAFSILRQTILGD